MAGDSVPRIGNDDDAFLLNLNLHMLDEGADDLAKSYRQLLDILFRQRGIGNFKEMHRDIKGLIGIQDYKHFVNRVDTLTGSQRQSVIKYIVKTAGLVEKATSKMVSGPALIYREISKFLGTSEGTLMNNASEACGVYQLWRAVKYPTDHFVKGMLRIWYDGGAVHASFTLRNSPSDDISKKHFHNYPSHEERLDGYLIRHSSDKCFVLLSDKSRKHIRVTFFSSISYTLPKGNSKKIDVMYGNVLGMNDSKDFISRVYVRREFDDPTLDDTDEQAKEFLDSLRVYPKEETPPVIVDVLKSLPYQEF